MAVLESIRLPEGLAIGLQKEIKKAYKEFGENDKLSVDALSKEIPKLERKLDQLYDDKLDGVIDGDFYNKKQREFLYQLDKIKIQIENKIQTSRDRFEFAKDLIELCKDAPSLYKQATATKKRMLINLISSNLYIKGENLFVELKPIFHELAKSAYFEENHPELDSNQ